MGRKNIFEAAIASPAPPSTNPTSLRRPEAPSMASLGSSLREMAANGIQDLDPAQIDMSGIQDRLEFDAEEISKLAESIRTHGQQVPILVRPHPDRMNRFTIVYGRRRLAAIRSLGNGTRIKAIVRHLEDDAAVIAQGQENNLRIDPSFIEKALFVSELRKAGYENQVIQDALGVDRTAISKMMTVVENVPHDVILFIGAAPEQGRRQWTELAQIARDEVIDITGLIPEVTPEGSTGAQRFEIIIEAARDKSAAYAAKLAEQKNATVPAVTVAKSSSGGRPATKRFDIGGRHVGTLKKTGRSLSLNVSLRHQPQFGQWLEENADEVVALIHDRWTKSREEG